MNKVELAGSTRGRPRKEDHSDLTTLRQEDIGVKEDIDIVNIAAAYVARGR